jgi:hypothetical protein
VTSLIRDSREFAVAHDLAPSCEPAEPRTSVSTAPPPENVPPAEADDGTNLSACADGTCEVTITGTATVTVVDHTVEVIVENDQVTTTERYAGGGMGTSTTGLGGTVSFGNTAQTITIAVNGLSGATAVLEFSLN